MLKEKTQMKTSKILTLVLALTVILSVSAFAADAYKIDFESFDAGYEIGGDTLEDGFYRWVNYPHKVVSKDNSKVLCIDQTRAGENNGFIRLCGASVSDSANKPVKRWGKQFVVSYRLLLEVPKEAGGMVFNNRMTDSKDNEGFETLRIWANERVESADGQVADFSFGAWHTVTNNYDFDAKTITTFIDGAKAFSQPLPDKVEGEIDWKTDICYMTLGRNWTNDTNTGYIYLDDITFSSGKYTPGPAPSTSDASVAVAVAALAAICVAVVGKKKR